MARTKSKAKPKPVLPPPPERVTRVVTLPIREVAGATQGVLDTFRPTWRLATDLANWCQRELVLHDPGLRSPDATKIGKLDPKPFPGGRSLYQWVNHAWPHRRALDGATDVISIVTKNVETTWRRHPRFGRFAAIWKGEARPCVFRWPYPVPFRSDCMRLSRSDVGRPLVSLVMPGHRVVVRLADGADFRRQLRQFDQLLADPARVKQAKVTARFDNGKVVGADLRLVGSFDVTPAADRSAGAVVRTDPHALLVVEVEGRPPWVLNCDPAPRLQAAHKAVLQRMGEDLKREKRLSRSQRARLNAARERRCEKHRNRIDTLVHQATAQAAGYLARLGASVVVYDDSTRSFIKDGFPWAALKDRLTYKLAGLGIEVVGVKPVPAGMEK